MKKILMLLICFSFPLNALAYSNYIIPGGETLGIEINSKGIMVIGFYQIKGKYNKGNPNIKSGDYITKINNNVVSNIKELTKEIEKNINNKEVEVTFYRDNKLKTAKLSLIEDDGIFKTGIYVKESIGGIGTLTYIDPITKIYGALGHEIIESNTSNIVEIKSGKIFKSSITSIDKSSNGVPGSKNAKFYYDFTYGSINKNTSYGIYGLFNYDLPKKKLLEVGRSNDIKIGNAKIYTVLKNETIEEYNINITSINESSNIKNISFLIEDETLINKTGGVVQGMSGSPIIQNDKIIGAVTHVIVDNPLTGYGIFITTMLEEGEK
ncbi:MAG: SpoIVB peptidase S55 domain-containing protein [Bacilli bacterium]